MKLSYEQLVSVTSGAVEFHDLEEGFCAYHFTAQQRNAYQIRSEVFNDSFYAKSCGSSGITLRFRTNSPWLKLAVHIKSASSRQYFSVDVTADGKLVGSVDNFEMPAFGTNFTTMQAPMGDFAGEFSLGEGEKTVCVYLPWSVICTITALELADGASLVPVKYPKKLLAFGDSITHGYDALRPTNKYITQVAEALGMEEFNKAIGGEVFWPELAQMEDPFTPDLITVAYGTNDWRLLDYEVIKQTCESFFQNLRKTYPNVPVVAITPIWRADHSLAHKPFSLFPLISQIIRDTVDKIGNAYVVEGWELVPQDTNLYADLRLHPNDEGFVHYAKNLLAAMPNEVK